jgi:hypothetical protein
MDALPWIGTHRFAQSRPENLRRFLCDRTQRMNGLHRSIDLGHDATVDCMARMIQIKHTKLPRARLRKVTFLPGKFAPGATPDIRLQRGIR